MHKGGRVLQIGVREELLLAVLSCRMTRMLRIRCPLAAAMVLVSTLWARTSGPPDSNSSGFFLEVPKRVDAVYPAEALRGKLQGEVILKVSIADTGEVKSAEIISGNSLLAASALTAAKGWIFKTWLHKKYVPLSAWATIAFDFQLPDERSQAPSTPSEGLVVTGRVIESGEQSNISITGPLHVSAGVTQGLVIYKVQPLYPPEARRARVQGTVVLRAVISREGTIENLRVISGDSMLVDAAADAVRQWRYHPYILNGDAVEVDTEVVIHFTLSER